MGAAAQDLAPDALFSRVAGSVYIVLAADNADLKAMMGNPVVPPPEPGSEGANREGMPTARERALRATGRGKTPPLSLGSAVALTRDIAVTNCHVVANREVVALVEGNKGVIAHVVESRPSDICLLRVSGFALKPVGAVRPAGEVRVGERAYAIGNPRGLERTLSEGLVSGVRTRGTVRIVQTTAAISPGSSGGGLFDASGRLIGITTFKSRTDAQLNFAVATEEFWPLSAAVVAGGPAPTPQAQAPATVPAMAPPPPQLQPDAVTRCGPIQVRGISFTTASVKCVEAEQRKVGPEPVEVARLSGQFQGGTVDVMHSRITSERTWGPLSSASLKKMVEAWAKSVSPTNVSSFEINPFPHYKLNVTVNGRSHACARGHARGGAQDKVMVWITYCEPGQHAQAPENLAAVFGALRFD